MSDLVLSSFCGILDIELPSLLISLGADHNLSISGVSLTHRFFLVNYFELKQFDEKIIIL
jgi:hypothetical protein